MWRPLDCSLEEVLLIYFHSKSVMSPSSRQKLWDSRGLRYLPQIAHVVHFLCRLYKMSKFKVILNLNRLLSILSLCSWSVQILFILHELNLLMLDSHEMSTDGLWLCLCDSCPLGYIYMTVGMFSLQVFVIFHKCRFKKKLLRNDAISIDQCYVTKM